ncbi:MAG: carbohydrate kinase family protein [Verrucomicrobia bacterium]|nr:carbohydrate kinase family protein [Verrucomicrobiota bacterium]
MVDRKGILGAGNWIVDHVKVIDAWPSQDALANIISEYRGTGGSPFNVLVDLAKLGADFPLTGAGMIGQDEAGDWLLEVCQKFGVNTALIRRRCEQPTSYTDVMTVAGTGRRTFFHQRGANILFDESSIRLETFDAKIFHLGYLLLLDRLDEPSTSFGTRAAELLQNASKLGFITSADVVSEESNRFARVLLPALPFLDIIFLNEFEAGQALGVTIRRDEQIDVPVLLQSAATLVAAGVRRWVIIHFPEGALALSPDAGRIFQPSLQVPPDLIAGAAGAGDAFAAGLLLGYHDGRPMEDCLVYGVCAAAASLRHPSTSGSVENITACLALADDFGYRRPLL